MVSLSHATSQHTLLFIVFRKASILHQSTKKKKLRKHIHMKILPLFLLTLITVTTAFQLPGTSTSLPSSSGNVGGSIGYFSQKTNDHIASSRRRFLETTATLLTAATFYPKMSHAAATTPTTPTVEVGGKIQYGDESIMSPKAHGTSERPVQDDLLYGVSNKLADKITNFNRHFAEMGGYFQSTSFEDIVLTAKGPITFYDSVTGKPLFVAPIGRSAEDFITESEIHGWPSFRDQEVVWENVRILKNSGETVSIDGTHLGHNIPDRQGNRYCINLVSVAGKPMM